MAISLEPLLEFQANNEFVDSLYNLSAARQRDGSGRDKTCLPQSSPAGRFMAINLDKVKSLFCRSRGYPLGGLSADALLMQGDELYLIEFKTSKLRDGEWYRKIYDSVLFLVELGVLTWQDCRDHLTFVTVQTDAGVRFRNYNLGERTGKSYGPIWEYDPADVKDPDADARVLTGQVAKRIYRLTPDDFDAFIVERKWHPQKKIQTWVSVMLGPYDVSKGLARNAVYPADWSSPVVLPVGLTADEGLVGRFLRYRAERLIKMNSATEAVRFADSELLDSSPGKAFYGVCENPLSPDQNWYVAAWMRDAEGF